MEFLESRFVGAEVKVSVGHTDQSCFHVHALLEYGDGTNLTQDLNRQYGKKGMQYSDMQIDFNTFMRGHNICRKYNLNMDEIVRGGRKEYLSLPQYKELTKQVKASAVKQVEKVFDNLDYYNFGFFKVPTLKSMAEVKDVLLKSIRNKLINAQIPTLINRLIKRNSELKIQNELHEIKSENLREKLLNLQKEFKEQTSKMTKLEQLDIKNNTEINAKAKKIADLDNQISILQIQLSQGNNKNVGD